MNEDCGGRNFTAYPVASPSPGCIRRSGVIFLAVMGLFLGGCRSRVAPPPDVMPPVSVPAPVTSPMPAPTPGPMPAPEAETAVLPIIAYTIQVGAFSTADRAADYADRLAAYGLDAYYFVDTDGLCKVRFERFDAQEAALARARALQVGGVIEAYYIVQPGASGHPVPVREHRQANLVATARRFIGTPYRWGGTSANSGFDCSGLTMTVYRLNGMDLPRSSRSQYASGRPVSPGALEKGDLVFFATNRTGRISHVGIYSGEGRFIHAPGKGKSIRTASLSNRWFKDRYVGARRYF